MKKEIRLRAVIFYSLILLITIIAIDLFFEPRKYLNFDFLYKRLDKITSAQKIAPQRLFVNVWRSAKNEYFDVSMNGQNWLRWRNRYLKYIKTSEDADLAINSMLLSLNDPYTRFLNAEMYEKQKDIIDSKVKGVGIIVDKSGEDVVINHVMENSPAQKSSILPGDVLVSINGLNVQSNSINNILASEDVMKSNTVDVRIKRNNKIIEKKLEKSRIPIKTMDYKIKDDIAIITLATIMGDDAVSDFIRVIKKTNNTKAIIIDLRDNYGGVVSNAVDMANHMLDSEKIVSVESRGNNKLQIYANRENIFKKKPIVIIVNKNTASAAEILAGTLKDNLGAVIVGENTYGKNAIQQIIPMNNSTGLVVTSNRYILPQCGDIHNKGLEPDIYIKDKSKEKDVILEQTLKIAKQIVKNKNKVL